MCIVVVPQLQWTQPSGNPRSVGPLDIPKSRSSGNSKSFTTIRLSGVIMVVQPLNSVCRPVGKAVGFPAGPTCSSLADTSVEEDENALQDSDGNEEDEFEGNR